MTDMYDQILEVTRRQAEAARAQDVETAIALLDLRASLVSMAPRPSAANESTIREILDLERDVATAIRHRMLAIREEVLSARHGQQALAGYAAEPRTSPLVFDLPA